MRVFIVDDHYIVRQGLADLLASEGIEVAGAAKDAHEALLRVFEAAPDAILVDLNLGDGPTGIELIGKLLEMRPEAKILVFSMRSSLPTINAAYSAGARAYVAKASDPDLLLEALHAIAAGKTWFMPGVAEQLAVMHMRGGSENPKKALTDKEFALFMLMAKGTPAQQAAEKLGLSQKTVANRLVDIRKKLGAAEDFAKIASQHGLINE